MKEILIAIGMPILRSVGGWASVAFKDNKITKFEIKKLIETIIRTGIIGVIIYFGAENIGLDVNIIASSATAILIDLITKKKETLK